MEPARHLRICDLDRGNGGIAGPDAGGGRCDRQPAQIAA